MFIGMDFCRRLRHARKKAGYTLTQAAEKSYLSSGAIGHYEKGIRVPPIDRVATMANLYGVSIDWLCGMEGVKKWKP